MRYLSVCIKVIAGRAALLETAGGPSVVWRIYAAARGANSRRRDLLTKAPAAGIITHIAQVSYNGQYISLPS